MSTVRGAPPCLAGGMSGPKVAHCSSVTSLGYGFRIPLFYSGKLLGQPLRDKLIRETFELDRDIAFATFRRLHMWNPEIVQACPHPDVRAQMLLGFWRQDAEKRYAEYQEKAGLLSTEELLETRAQLREVMAREEFQRIFKGERIDPEKSQDRQNDNGRER
jgi:hypothetical protein